METERKLSPPSVIASLNKDDSVLLLVVGSSFYCIFSDEKKLTFYDWEANSTSSILVEENVSTLCCDPCDNKHMEDSSDGRGNNDNSSSSYNKKCNTDRNESFSNNRRKVFGLTLFGKVCCWHYHLEKGDISMMIVYDFKEVKSRWTD